MTASGQKRTRSERVAALELPPGQWERTWTSLHRRDMLGRIGLALLAALAMGAVIRAWVPPFAYRVGYTPARKIVSRVSFTDPVATRLARQRAQNRILCVYVNHPDRLAQLRSSLRNAVVELGAVETLSDLDQGPWGSFQTPAEAASPPSAQKQQEQFQRFRAALAGAGNPDRFETAIKAVFLPFEQRGLLERLPPEHENGNRQQIRVHPKGQPEPLQIVKVSEVLIGDGTVLKKGLLEQFGSDEVAERLFAWIWPRLRRTATLKLDEAQTKPALEKAAASVPEVVFEAGELLAKRGKPLDEQKIRLFRLEYEAFEYGAGPARRPTGQKVARAAAVVALIFALFLLCGMYMRYRQRGPLASMTRLSVMFALAIGTVALARWASADAWRAEIIPLMLFGMTMAIVYRQELALLLSGVLALILALAIGQGLHGFLLLIGVTTTANLNMGHIRTRAKLIYVGLFAGGVAILLDIGLGLVGNQPVDLQLLGGAARNGLWALGAGFLMTGLLPFIEKLFGVLTDLSLLELGDVAHPLLQELVRRAPSTHNHSITVGSIAEAAAESIGARGLLVRVGAYFHDIGKMLKPGYFVENQGPEENRHEALVPAMSSLVIVAHIKDGADLARQHRLPQPIIDLIQQHHGTTMVGFFYERAHQQSQSDPNGGEVDESRYRYPGPKPQTKEAAVLMLADSVESASRTLVDPTPARIESLVHEVAERRLHSGQFDESGLTLRELRAIEKSLIISLTSIYHGRIKYPEQKTA